jgi:hypothetical protein
MNYVFIALVALGSIAILIQIVKFFRALVRAKGQGRKDE